MKIKDIEIFFVVAETPAAGAQAAVLEVKDPEAAVREWPAQKIISVSLDAGRQKDVSENLRRVCAGALRQAAEEGCASIALPAMGAQGHIDPVASAKIILQEILKIMNSRPVPFKKVFFCLEGEEMRGIFEKTITGYARHLTEDLGRGPYVTVDAIIEVPEGVILIKRSNPPYGWALPGGFVDYNESLEEAVIREAKEETDMDLADIRQMHTYSAPERDPRFHTITTVFVARGIGRPQAGDDAKGLKIVKYGELMGCDYAFDHKKVVADYLEWKQGREPWLKGKGHEDQHAG